MYIYSFGQTYIFLNRIVRHPWGRYKNRSARFGAATPYKYQDT